MFQWQMREVQKDFVLCENKVPALHEGEALVKVAGCGVCHTDISFWHHGVKTRHELPLTLGHEISGTVVDGPSSLLGKKVIVPAVLPCGECSFCKKGRSNICRKQLMPGNDFDGGFASHVKVPARFLCEVPEAALRHYPLEQLSVVADAISTPWQVIRKSEIEPGDLAIVIGAGGVGSYGAQLAKVSGAKVLAMDINDNKLEPLKHIGIHATLNIKGLDPKAIKEKVKEIASYINAPASGWKIFEMSGTRSGQETAFNLLTYTSTLSVVGFTMDKTEVRLSNLMAFDAKIIGTWGCRAEFYPDVVKLIADGQIKIDPFTETFPMSEINEIFRGSVAHKYNKRPVLVPDFK